MRSYKARIFRQSSHVVAVSQKDAQRMRDMFGIDHVSHVETGVDVQYFKNPGSTEPEADFIFCRVDGLAAEHRRDIVVRQRNPSACRAEKAKL